MAILEERLGSLWQDEPQNHYAPTPSTRFPANTFGPGNMPGNVPGSVKNMHEKLPQHGVEGGRGQAAFRNIFPEDEDGDLPDPAPSPQFKNI